MRVVKGVSAGKNKLSFNTGIYIAWKISLERLMANATELLVSWTHKGELREGILPCYVWSDGS